MKKAVVSILAIALLCTIFMGSAFAWESDRTPPEPQNTAEGYSPETTGILPVYIVADGETVNPVDGFVYLVAAGFSATFVMAEGAAPLTDAVIDCDSRSTVTIENVVIDMSTRSNWPALVFRGVGCKLIISGENEFYGGDNYPGVMVSEGTELTISGDGELWAMGGTAAAGIGSNYADDGGTTPIASGIVNITSGTVYASALFDFSTMAGGAGIGGSAYGDGGTVNISGGKVHAYGNYGAGIGGGDWGGAGGTVNISGGTVETISYGGAGIGGGYIGDCGIVNITGGRVIAEGDGGAGIGGGGPDLSGNFGDGGDVTIEGDAVVFASGYDNGMGLHSDDIGAGQYGTVRGTLKVDDDAVVFYRYNLHPNADTNHDLQSPASEWAIKVYGPLPDSWSGVADGVNIDFEPSPNPRTGSSANIYLILAIVFAVICIGSAVIVMKRKSRAV